MRSRWGAYTALALGVFEVCLILASWVLSVLLPDSGVRSMLSGGGLRRFMGGFADMLSGEPLAWLILLSVACGCAADSGIVRLLRCGKRRLLYRERIARSFVVCIMLCYVVGFMALGLIPDAVLLSASGQLFPSPFLSALVPVTAFGVCLLSVVYGVVSGRYRSVTDVYRSLLMGIGMAAPLFVHYILLTQLYYSVLFVFC